MKKTKKNESGFNLIELMLVIAVISLLIGVGSIAYHTMVRSGNETTAAILIQNIKTLQTRYASKHQGQFAPNFEALRNSGSLDERFKGETPLVNGYVFEMNVEAPTTSKPAFYSISANPQVSEGVLSTGTRHFYFDSSLATIRATEENRPATAADDSM